MHSPPCRRLAVLGFPDPFLAADAVPDIIRYGPIGLEGIDDMLLDFMRRKHLADDDMHLLPEGGASCSPSSAPKPTAKPAPKRNALLDAASRISPASPTGRVCSLEEAPRIWHIRESAPRLHGLRSRRAARLGRLGRRRRLRPKNSAPTCANFGR